MCRTVPIHEFSKISGVDATTLRYWDSIGVFNPIMRNPETKYRYYAISQLITLNFVTTLSELNIPLKTIGELRRERDPAELLDLLEKQECLLDMQMRRINMQYSIIHTRRELINQGIEIDESEVYIRHLEDKSIILWPRNEYSDGDTFLDPLSRHIGEAYDYHISLSFPVGGYHDNMESFIERPGLPDHFFSIDPVGTCVRKGGDYLIGFVRGQYGELGDLPERMAEYAHKHSIRLTGPVFIKYLHEEICITDPSQYLAQCSIAVETKEKRKR